VTTDSHVIYLLHFPESVSGVQHYLGITRRSQLRDRLRKHLGGFGAGLTARAAAQCSHMTLVALWSRQTFAAERKLKTAGHLKRYCAICSGTPPATRQHVHHVNILLSIPKAALALGLTKQPLSW
jgi:hypothetical protein